MLRRRAWQSSSAGKGSRSLLHKCRKRKRAAACIFSCSYLSLCSFMFYLLREPLRLGVGNF